jgi:hypothetical protein
VAMERGPLSLVRIIEELLQWKSSGFGQENRINVRGGSFFILGKKITVNTKTTKAMPIRPSVAHSYKHLIPLQRPRSLVFFREALNWAQTWR